MDLFKTENIDQFFSSNRCLLEKIIIKKKGEKSKSSLGYCHGNKFFPILCISSLFFQYRS